jgi:hypothetical protein
LAFFGKIGSTIMTARMAQRSSLSREHLFYFLILLLAIALRFAGLGVASLNEFEASAALPAAQLAASAPADLGAQPGYVLLTSLLFGLVGSSEFVARLFPALLGVVLVLLPFFWRDLLGKKAALVFALLLAVDPGLVSISRLASGSMLALAAALLALTAWRYQHAALAGMLAAFAIFSAPLIYVGIGALLLTWASQQISLYLDRPSLRKAGLAFLGTLALGGTLFLSVPQGISGVGQVLSAFLFGLPNLPGSSLLTILLAMLGYAWPALVFGGLGALRAWRQSDPVARPLSVFTSFALLLVVLNPSRQIADLVWVLLPLWALAAIEISRYLQAPDEEPAAAIGEASLMLVLAAFLVPMLARIANQGGFIVPEAGGYAQFIVVAFVIGIALLATVLIALGWSRRSAMLGLAWAGALLSMLFLLSASTRFARIETTAANELWSPGPAAGQLGIMLITLDDLSFWDQGAAGSLAIDVRTDSAALGWALRGLQTIEDQAATSTLAVTLAEDTPTDFADTRGQSFALNLQRAWEGWPPNFLAWLLFRQAPVQSQQLILWADTDLFADAILDNSSVPEGTTP